MRLAFGYIIQVLKITVCISFQFPSPTNRGSESFNLARSQGQSAQENTIVIQSKAYNISNSNESVAETAQLKHNIYVQKGEGSEAYTEPKSPQFAIDCGDDKVCLEAHGLDSEATFKPYSQDELEKILAQYAASHGKPPEIEDESPSNKLANLYMDEEDAVINVLETNPKINEKEESKSGSWHLLQSQKHHHPYQDHKGWVTLEPVPWAQSQIQKWEPNAKPQIPSWDPPSQHHPWPSHDYSTERPWNRPSYDYKPSRPQWGEWPRPDDFPDRPSSPSWGGNPDIITDNKPGYFPAARPSQRPWYDQEPFSSNRPTQIYEDRPLHHGHHGHPATHPSEGDGQWVLLSSTKGYSAPFKSRGRSLTLHSKTPSASMSSHRTVRLTVLPADNSTNTTLSHDGLLEVESSQQTVDEAQREHAAKMLKLKTITPEEVKSTPSAIRVNSRRSGESIQVFSASPTDAQSKTAILAAIGAGLIPASMAMLLPMVLGRRKRSIKSGQVKVNKTHVGSELQV